MNQEFKTAPKSFHEYMPIWKALTSVNWAQMIAELVISVSRFFPSDLVGAYFLQASIVKPARLTHVPAAVRALDDALYQSIRNNNNCPALATKAVEQFVTARSVQHGSQLTGIALLACMLESVGITQMTQREVHRKCTREGRFGEDMTTAREWNDALTDLNVDLCSTQPKPPSCEAIGGEINCEIKRLGRKVKDPKFTQIYKEFEESNGTQFRKMQRFQAAVAIWYKEEIRWSHDDLVAAIKMVEAPMCQRSGSRT